MRLWYHGDSDSLYWSDEWDALSDDVTTDPAMRRRARDLGIREPKLVTVFEEEKKPITNMAEAIVESYKRWERKPADLYPTPCDATESLIPLLESLIENGKLPGRKVWEPACGDGRLSRVLEWHGFDVFSSDLRKYSGYGTGDIDFLMDHFVEMGWEPAGVYDAIITNPPFSVAREFVEKALKIAPVVIMLVKQNYWNTKGRLTMWDEHRPSFFLPITWRLAFLKEERGNSPLMDCAWCVWIRDWDEPGCFIEPIRRRVYPGYHGKGLKGATAGLTEAIDELATALADLRK